VAYVLAAALLWGLGGALAGRFMAEIPPGVLIPLRFFFSALLLSPLLALRPPGRAEWGRLFLVGLALAGAQGFYYLAIHAAGVATGIFLQYLAPVLLVVYDRLRGVRVPRETVYGVGIALLGVYLLVAGPEGIRGGALGVASGLAAAVSFAAYAALSQGLRTAPASSLAAASLVGSLLSLPLLAPRAPEVLVLGTGGYLAVAYLVVFGTVLPFSLFLAGVRRVPARVATLVAMVEPVAGALFAVPLAGEPLSARALLGGGLILFGVVLGRR